MRSHSFLRKPHLFVKRSSFTQPASSFRASGTCTLKYRNLVPSDTGIPTKRFFSIAAPASVAPEENTKPLDLLQTELELLDSSLPSEELDKDKVAPKPRRRVNGSSSKESDALELPAGLENDILYVPTQSLLDSRPGGLPPPEIFEEALDNLLITFHPQNQVRSLSSASAGPSGQPVEPTLGLYCPIEGGDYVLDLTVHELAYQTGAEVVILDTVHLAAGEFGPFGKAGSALNLPENPLHFSAPQVQPLDSSRDQSSNEAAEEGDPSFMFPPPTKLSLSLPKTLSQFPFPSRISPSASRKTGPTKLDILFETLINLPAPQKNPEQAHSADSKSRPRLIYIRDLPTLAQSSSLWYPSLLAAVRQRRRAYGPSSPVTVVFGLTPPVTPPAHETSFGPSNLMSLLMNRNSPGSQMHVSRRSEPASDWGEGEAADVARENRLRARLRKWERSTSGFQDELASPVTQSEDSESNLIGAHIFVIGGPGSGPLPLGSGAPRSSGESALQFYRSTTLVPRSRSLTEEKETRISRRREINELIMRMGVGVVGGMMEEVPAAEVLLGSAAHAEDSSSSPSSSTVKSLWDDWGHKVEIWSNVRKIADRAVGSVMMRQRALTAGHANLTLDSLTIPWSAVQAAWISNHSMISSRKTWLKDAMAHVPIGDDLGEGQDDLSQAGSAMDKVVEAIKNDPDLDSHESRLLSCIVDSGSINTTFNQVHLPPQTIDAVRTIVSLPLLHPQAFQHGILKDHGMTGCLLFGPPGTGKTLVVRALAKEAGCRMLGISPSDVMDMYVGEGEKLVRAVFSLARRLSPCVVFLDEIDALFGARMSARESGSAFAHRGVITEFMQEMDGLKSSKDDNVIVIGATNRPFDLDDAVLRRLPRRLLVDLPGEKERHAILKILLRDEQMADDVNIEALAKKTDGFSGSDLKHLCVSAALDSVKENTVLPWTSHRTPDTPGIDIISTADMSIVEAATPTSTATDPHTHENFKAAEAVPENIEEVQIGTRPVALPSASEVETKQRMLKLNNFTQALKEITPSSSETLGSLAELRKWNEEFGEGRKDKKKRQVWGKGRFGFVNIPEDIPQEGRVANEQSTSEVA